MMLEETYESDLLLLAHCGVIVDLMIEKNEEGIVGMFQRDMMASNYFVYISL